MSCTVVRISIQNCVLTFKKPIFKVSEGYVSSPTAGAKMIKEGNGNG